MRRKETGTYITVSTAGEPVRAFVPHELPPDPPIDLSGARQRLLERATLALGRLDSISMLLPDPDIFLYAYVRREAVVSSQIEGTQSSLADLLLFEIEEAPGVPLDDVAEVSGYVAALNHGVKRLHGGFPLSNRLLREMHRLLLASGRGAEQSPGEFRRTQNWIGGSRPGNAHYVPPPPARVEECMSALERFIHDERSQHPTLVKAALAHVQFETIHPFLDGNGRIGRLLIAFMLHQGGVLDRPLLYLSLFFKQHRDQYYQLLDRVRSEGEWEAWIEFFLQGVEETATNAVQTARQLVRLFNEDRVRIQALGRAASSALRLFDSLCAQPITTVNELHSRTGLSFPTTTKAVSKLAELGIAKEITGGRRNRVFSYTAYMEVLSQGTERI
jgi:Fic family protein